MGNTEKDGCSCCHGDEAVYYRDNENNAFIDHTGEMLVTAHDHTIRFHVDRCPKCGFVFATVSTQEEEHNGCSEI